MSKCNTLKNKWCGAIEKIADFGNPEASGIAVSMVVNVENGAKGHGIRYGLKKSEWNAKGFRSIWVNFCPFCGANVSKRTGKAKR